MRSIKVLIVDASPVFRDLITDVLRNDTAVTVVAAVRDPIEARDAILKFDPAVMVLGVELPRMNGIEFLRKLMPQYPVATIVFGETAGYEQEARAAGAVDFLKKPSSIDLHQIEQFIIKELVVKIKIASTVKVGSFKQSATTFNNNFSITGNNSDIIIAIGASTGGTEAIFEVVKNLGRNTPGIVIVQHMPPGFTGMYANRLNEQCKMAAKEAQTGDRVMPGQILIAPGDRQMHIVKINGVYQVECKGTQKVNGHCPSVDVMFKSVAKCAGRKAIGVLLTGMGSDGAQGLLEMRRAGAQTIGQNEASCVVYGMPKVAHDIGAVKYQVGLTEIPNKIYALLNYNTE